MQRIFVAIDISYEAREQAREHLQALKRFSHSGVSWVRPESLHLTVRFVGACDRDQVETVQRIVGEVAREIPPFTLAICNPGMFSPRQRASILWIGVSGDLNAIRLAKEKFEEQYATGEKRQKLTPHLTIARVKHMPSAAIVIDRHLTTQFEPVAFAVNELVVYESKLLPTGPVYTAISRHKLGSSD